MLGPVAGQAELTSRQRLSLAEDGYLLMPSLLPAHAVAALAARLDELARAIIAERDAPAEQWDGVVSVRLDPADPGYAPLVRQPLLFSAADTVIGPGCQVDGLSLRAPLPGCGHQADDMEFPGMGPHPDEVKLIAPAGSMILFNSASLWHSGTLNYSPGLRLAVTTYLSAPTAP